MTHVGTFQNSLVFENWFNGSKVIQCCKIPLFTLFLWSNDVGRHISTLNQFSKTKLFWNLSTCGKQVMIFNYLIILCIFNNLYPP